MFFEAMHNYSYFPVKVTVRLYCNFNFLIHVDEHAVAFVRILKLKILPTVGYYFYVKLPGK